MPSARAVLKKQTERHPSTAAAPCCINLLRRAVGTTYTGISAGDGTGKVVETRCRRNGTRLLNAFVQKQFANASRGTIFTFGAWAVTWDFLYGL